MDQAIRILHTDLSSIRAGRVSTAVVENIKIKVYGGTQELTLSQLGTISITDAQTLTFTPFDISIVSEIERGLLKENRSFGVHVDGEVIRIKLPPLTEERRNEFVKLAKTKTEGVKVMVRQARHEAINHVRGKFGLKEIGEDVKFRMEKDIQKITDQKIEDIDQVLEGKVEELETV